ncbi:MAG: type I-C CRISPR-associated endonuclease Cas1c [Saccharofermentanales bacterium]|jgi:CRISPR-associated protein Cas1
MRKLLNNLYITNEDVMIKRQGETIIVNRDNTKLGQFPIHIFENIICFNYTGMSPQAMALCLESGVEVTFLSPQGWLLGKVHGPLKGNVLLRRKQYRVADDPCALNFGKLFIEGKLFNSIRVLDRALRDHGHRMSDKVSVVKQQLIHSRSNLAQAADHETLLGLEGDAARQYFSVFDELILQQKEDFHFKKRIRRPPIDPVNALLSLSYGLLRTLTENALNTVGLDPYVGFLHQDRSGRTSLALDLMEELRPYMADRFVLSIINRKQINLTDFYTKEAGVVLFNEDGLKKMINLWNNRLQDTITHPYLEETIEIGLLPYVQAMLLARTLRGDLEMYPPYMST